MADRGRRGAKQRRREGEPEKPSKEEYAVAKHLRFNLPTREGKLVGMPVQYFIASKAIDMMLDSKWGASAKGGALFTTRNACVEYCNNLLNKGIFHRAARVGKRKDRERERDRDATKKKRKLKETEEETKEGKEEEKKLTKAERRKTKKDKKKEEEVEEVDKEKESEGEKEDKKEKEKEREKETQKKEEEKKEKDEEKRKKKKVKLEMHDHQIFKDGDEIYVWIYDPVPFKTFIIGLLLVLGAVAVCMFPLWPPEVRLGIYYLSLAAAGFVGVILALCVIRLILFCLVWGLTFGRHHFWFLPNLTEDVGFFDSFRPLYKHDYCDGKPTEKQAKSDAAAGDAENKDEGKTTTEGKKEWEKEDEEKGSDKEESVEGSEDNGYEIVDREDFLQREDEEQESEPPQEDNEDENEDETKKTK